MPDDRFGELLDLLPPEMREVLVLRYALDWTHGEIALRLGISGDAVAMRLARAKARLRRALDAEHWRQTGIWCPCCGNGRLELRREAEHDAVVFRCAACDPHRPASVLPLDNPLFGRLLAGLQRPSAMLARVGDWSYGYWRSGDGAGVECTRCGAAATARAHRREDLGTLGLFVACARCGEQLWTSLVGVALATREVRALRRRVPRAAARQRDEPDAIVISFGEVEVAFAHGTHRLVAVR
jgi:hypothetical protein